MVRRRAWQAGSAPQVERRAPQPVLYSPDQLLGRAPIRLRRASDRRRLAGHLVVVVLVVPLTAWWVVPAHSFAGPVVLTLTASHGVHLGDLPTLAFLGAAARSIVVARRLGARLLSPWGPFGT